MSYDSDLYQSRKFKRLLVNPNNLVSFYKQYHYFTGKFSSVLPNDTIVVNCGYDNTIGMISIIISSESFHSVAEGEIIPELESAPVLFIAPIIESVNKVDPESFKAKKF